MTNADKIRSMTDDELVKFLHDINQNGGFQIEGYCKGGCKYIKQCEYAGKCCDDDVDADIKWWLKQEVNV